MRRYKNLSFENQFETLKWLLFSIKVFAYVETFANHTFYPSVELEFAQSFKNVTTFFLAKVNTIVQVPLLNRGIQYMANIW